MAPARRPRFWNRFFENFPPWPPRELAALMCHSSGKLVERRGLPDETGGVQRRWLTHLAAALAAIGMLLLLTKLAWGEAPTDRNAAPVATAGV